MFGKIKVKRNPYGDTRTAPKDTDYVSFSEATDWHREDVKNVMKMFTERVLAAGERHDWTKTGKLELEFFKDFKDALDGKREFKDGSWWPMHVVTERHHLSSYCPKDVNLVDVLEMVVDSVLAGFTRSGAVYPVEIDPEILKKAVSNTAEIVKNTIEFEE